MRTSVGAGSKSGWSTAAWIQPTLEFRRQKPSDISTNLDSVRYIFWQGRVNWKRTVVNIVKEVWNETPNALSLLERFISSGELKGLSRVLEVS